MIRRQDSLPKTANNLREQTVVDAENTDRRQVYAAIAKKENTTPELRTVAMPRTWKKRK
ncbi:YdbL family protein [Desulfosarcina sp. OttesenSCG-928-B08]|nr:YdbL family protein [Desulfosarcina sp. OttesenSCG-928-B08]